MMTKPSKPNHRDRADRTRVTILRAAIREFMRFVPGMIAEVYIPKNKLVTR